MMEKADNVALVKGTLMQPGGMKKAFCEEMRPVQAYLGIS